jgi:hypothetical protein
VSDTPLQSTLRELQRMLSEPKLWSALIGAALLLGLVGPFGTFDRLELLPRIAYWTAIVVITYAIGVGTVYFVVAAFFASKRRSLFAYTIAGLVSGLPVAGIVYGLNSQLYGVSGAGSFMELLVYCMAIAAVVSVLVALFSIPRPEDVAGEVRAVAGYEGVPSPAVPAAIPTMPAETPRPPILDRLPVHLRGPLAYMTMQDHYVDVHTEKGGTLVLMRMADAIAETRGVAGLQIHRSHWVATAAVAAAVRRDGRLFLRMKDGAELPVSRSYTAAVRDAGLGR